MKKVRVFGECMMAIAAIALSLYVGFAAVGSISTTAMVASLN